MVKQIAVADYVVLGRGNAKDVRLWEEPVEPHDKLPIEAWRVVR